MGLDKSQGNMQIAFAEPPVKQDSGAGTGRAQIDVHSLVAGVVGRDCVTTENLRSDDFL